MKSKVKESIDLTVQLIKFNVKRLSTQAIISLESHEGITF